MTRIFRTALISLLLAAAALLAYWRLSSDAQHRLNEELRALNTQLEQRLAQRQAMIDRLSRTRRVGHVEVLDQPRDATGRVESTRVRFIEIDDRGAELGRQDFTVPGAVVFIDAWTVKFNADDVAQGDPFRGRTLILLRRMYSDRMAPVNGLPIDTPGSIPNGYAGSEVVQFEQQLWSQFWQLASDRRAADAAGVRVAQGEAVYQQVAAGQRYELIVDAAGGLSLTPLPEDGAVLTQGSR